MKKSVGKMLAIVLITTGAAAIVWSSSSAAKEKKTAAKGSAGEGEKIFHENCNLCHFPDKTDKKIGPGLKGLFANKQLPESHKPVTEANVREQIAEGSPHAKPMPMPSFKDKLSPAQMDDLMAYLKTL
jgi:mono/diheme cytochrome c family protein